MRHTATSCHLTTHLLGSTLSFWMHKMDRTSIFFSSAPPGPSFLVAVPPCSGTFPSFKLQVSPVPDFDDLTAKQVSHGIKQNLLHLNESHSCQRIEDVHLAYTLRNLIARVVVATRRL